MGKTFFTSLLASIKISTLRIITRCRLFLGVMGMNKEFKVGEGKEKKVWDEAHFVWLYKHLCIALQLKRRLLRKRFSAFHTMLPP